MRARNTPLPIPRPQGEKELVSTTKKRPFPRESGHFAWEYRSNFS